MASLDVGLGGDQESEWLAREGNGGGGPRRLQAHLVLGRSPPNPCGALRGVGGTVLGATRGGLGGTMSVVLEQIGT